MGEQSNNKLSDNHANIGSNNYDNERDHNAHSANVSDGENESGNYAAVREQPRVGATGTCQGDHNDDNNGNSDYGTTEGNHDGDADNATRCDHDNKSNNHSETESNDKADHNNSTAYGDYDYEDHSSKAADHIKIDHDSD